jgi:uncharacterized protein
MRWATAEAAPQPRETTPQTLVGVMGVMLEVLVDGALWWEDERLLVVADLHFEKGSSFARRGQLLPPYDTAETLSRLSCLVGRFDPATVVALGDSFHDEDGADRMSSCDRATLARLQQGRSWIWIAGNHDPAAPRGLAGDHMESLALGRLVFRHEPGIGSKTGEIAGHLHPAARVAGHGRTVRRPCFVGDGERLILPAFGAYAGGLNILDRAFAGLFTRSLQALVLGKKRVYPVVRSGLRPD